MQLPCAACTHARRPDYTRQVLEWAEQLGPIFRFRVLHKVPYYCSCAAILMILCIMHHAYTGSHQTMSCICMFCALITSSPAVHHSTTHVPPCPSCDPSCEVHAALFTVLLHPPSNRRVCMCALPAACWLNCMQHTVVPLTSNDCELEYTVRMHMHTNHHATVVSHVHTQHTVVVRDPAAAAALFARPPAPGAVARRSVEYQVSQPSNIYRMYAAYCTNHCKYTMNMLCFNCCKQRGGLAVRHCPAKLSASLLFIECSTC